MTELTHLDSRGQAHMVDVSGKPVTRRVARAQAVVIMQPATIQLLRENALVKGDALAVARVAGIQAAKRTDEFIPLCHSLPISQVEVDFALDTDRITVTTSAATVAQTGVEMEALTAASVAALTLYDMAKSADKRIVIGEIHLLTKTGGKSGDWSWES